MVDLLNTANLLLKSNKSYYLSPRGTNIDGIPK